MSDLFAAGASLRARYPRTVERFAALPGGEAALAHVMELERGFAERRQRVTVADTGGPSTSSAVTYDVALAGGGLSLVYGAFLARAGWKVAIFDRRTIGRGHREWNISRRELRPLVESALFTDEELARLVLTEYQRGLVRWHGGRPHVVRGVLDCVIDAEAFLSSLRGLAERAGATLLDGHALTGYALGREGVRVDLAAPDGPVSLTARLLVDGTGAASPHARFDLVCPTVGGVLTGLAEGTADDEVDPATGEILASTEDVEPTEEPREGGTSGPLRQHIWEGFPGPGGRYTTYLFYYAEPDTTFDRPLLALYERFFRTLPRYKRGPATVEKSTYGFIPAYTRLRDMPAAPSDRVILVGDAAGRHSPLTFCGFGSMIRSFHPVAERLRVALAEDRLDRRTLARAFTEPPGLRVMGGLTLMMIPPGERGAAGPPREGQPRLGPAEINRLLDAAFSSLAELGEDTYASFVRDEIGFRDFLRFMRKTAEKRPTIYREVFQQLTPEEIAIWSWRFLSLAATKWRTG